MSKTHLPQNKETLIAFGLGFGLLVLTIINAWVIYSAVSRVYGNSAKQTKRTLIDQNAVEEAVKALQSQ